LARDAYKLCFYLNVKHNIGYSDAVPGAFGRLAIPAAQAIDAQGELTTWLPARQASRIPPAEALRYE